MDSGGEQRIDPKYRNYSVNQLLFEVSKVEELEKSNKKLRSTYDDMRERLIASNNKLMKIKNLLLTKYTNDDILDIINSKD